MKYYNNILETIGNTPLIKLNTIASHLKPLILVKVEYFNPGNSVKDRIGLKMIEDAEKAGLLKPGGTIIEGTSGNTGMGLALVAAIKGYRCIFTTNDKQSKEKIDILRALGAEVIVCPTAVPHDDPQNYHNVALRLNQEIPNSYFPNQYENPSNFKAHYEVTGPEIWEQTDGKITHYVAGIGTGGTISGVAKYLKEKNPNIKVIGIDTYGSVFKKYKETGIFDENEIYPYRIEGIGQDNLPGNVHFDLIDEIEKVTDKEAFLMTRKLARLEGLFVGGSCGAAVAGALRYAEKLSSDDVMVIILPDHGSRYIAKIYNDTWMKENGYLEEETQLTALDLVKRKSKDYQFIAANKTDTLAQVARIMQEKNISQMPVMENGEVVGSITESRLLNKLIDDPSAKGQPVESIMGYPFPFVMPYTTVDAMTKMITKDNPALLVKLDDSTIDIITKYDLIAGLTN
ncbi:MAG: cystathionine beta-synthase [Bacteroidia bacterium]|nr:cystathionine beta-synthase [Bacteroidia bacterium]MDW8346740.1 cystathionine beta-synthase [Bacteroidia bacterium]